MNILCLHQQLLTVLLMISLSVISLELRSLRAPFPRLMVSRRSCTSVERETCNIEPDKVRQVEMEKRMKRMKRRNEMPLSQSWYKSRQQQISKKQKKALASLWPSHGIDLKYNTTLNFHPLFNHTTGMKELFRPSLPVVPDTFSDTTVTQKTLDDSRQCVVLDIGFGNGESIVEMAKRFPFKLYIGCEIHRAGIAATLISINDSELQNIKLIRSDVTVLLENHLPDGCLDEICIFFPDPWPKSGRDAERRVIRPRMLAQFGRLLKPGVGRIHIATDAEEYATHIEATFSAGNDAHTYWQLGAKLCHPPTSRISATTTSYQRSSVTGEHRTQSNSTCFECLNNRPVTKYERKAQAQGRAVWEYVYLFRSCCG
mmetsp:Transcript_24492/g.40834  ORF Transcript_24492/g.40834 Transcript_24492/m.40834 type:complete len:371 (+) Transcript_24492:114-1226(+)